MGQFFSKILTFLTFFFICFSIFGQTQRWKYNRSEAIFGLGATNFLGELGGKNGIGTNNMSDFDFSAIRPLFHLGYAYKIGRQLTWVNDLTLGYLYGNDQFTDEEFRNNRNIHFRSSIFEFSSHLQIHFFAEKEGAKYTLSGYRLRPTKRSILQPFSSGKINIYPYLYAGICYFHFNPQAKYPDDGEIESMRGEWVSLKPLRTEGQGLYPTRPEYSLSQIAIPMGIGVKYPIDRTWSLGFEYGFRFTFTDYIDDVSSTYVSPDYIKESVSNELSAEEGELAAYFSNPTNTPNSFTAPGQQRGDIRDNDAYMFAKITVYYKVVLKDKIAIPKFK